MKDKKFDGATVGAEAFRVAFQQHGPPEVVRVDKRREGTILQVFWDDTKTHQYHSATAVLREPRASMELIELENIFRDCFPFRDFPLAEQDNRHLPIKEGADDEILDALRRNDEARNTGRPPGLEGPGEGARRDES